MRWIKHLTSSWDDESISSIVAEYGLEIYGFWWRILEIIAKQMDQGQRANCQYSAKVWGKYAGISAKKFQKLADILKEKNLIIMENCNGKITINVPNLLKYRDEFSKKKQRQVMKNPE